MTVTFSGVTVSAYQSGEINYDIQFSAARLLSGDIFVNLGSHTQPFPRRFDCHPASYDEITSLVALIGQFGTLVIDGTSYLNCYISQLAGIKELILGSGKYVYTITFGQADQH